MGKNGRVVASVVLVGLVTFGVTVARADDDDRQSQCRGLPSQSALRGALEAAQAQANGGFGLQMWATAVKPDGGLFGVAVSRNKQGGPWPGRPGLSPPKANTTNALPLPVL